MLYSEFKPFFLSGHLLFGRIYPSGVGQYRRLRRLFHEALGIFRIDLLQGFLAVFADGRALSGMDLPGCHQADAAVMMFVVVPLEEPNAERARILNRAEPFRKGRAIFHRLELAFGIGIIIGLADYRGSGYDRGHLAPNGDMPDPESQRESFTLANMIPQDPNNNRGLCVNAGEDPRLFAAGFGVISTTAVTKNGADGPVFVFPVRTAVRLRA